MTEHLLSLREVLGPITNTHIHTQIQLLDFIVILSLNFNVGEQRKGIFSIFNFWKSLEQSKQLLFRIKFAGKSMNFK